MSCFTYYRFKVLKADTSQTLKRIAHFSSDGLKYGGEMDYWPFRHMVLLRYRSLDKLTTFSGNRNLAA